ncbi:MAG: DciA family protein [Vicinamibacterales bacterium]
MFRAPDVLSAALAPAIRQAPLTAEKVAFAWRAAGGPAIDKATRVTLDDRHVLHVTGEDAQWLDAVRAMSPQLLRRLEPWLGTGTVVALEIAGAPAGRRPGRRRP